MTVRSHYSHPVAILVGPENIYLVACLIQAWDLTTPTSSHIDIQTLRLCNFRRDHISRSDLGSDSFLVVPTCRCHRHSIPLHRRKSPTPPQHRDAGQTRLPTHRIRPAITTAVYVAVDLGRQIKQSNNEPIYKSPTCLGLCLSTTQSIPHLHAFTHFHHVPIPMTPKCIRSHTIRISHHP